MEIDFEKYRKDGQTIDLVAILDDQELEKEYTPESIDVSREFLKEIVSTCPIVSRQAAAVAIVSAKLVLEMLEDEA